MRSYFNVCIFSLFVSFISFVYFFINQWLMKKKIICWLTTDEKDWKKNWKKYVIGFRWALNGKYKTNSFLLWHGKSVPESRWLSRLSRGRALPLVVSRSFVSQHCLCEISHTSMRRVRDYVRASGTPTGKNLGGGALDGDGGLARWAVLCLLAHFSHSLQKWNSTPMHTTSPIFHTLPCK